MLYLYSAFLISFLTSSGICYMDDMKKEDNDDYIINQYRDILPTVTMNTFFYVPIISILSERVINIKYSWEDFSSYACLCHILLAYTMIDLFFFVFHRMMHIPILYKWSHKLHHKYKQTVGMEALYLHWFDLYFGNILPLNIPIIIMPNLHIITWMLYIMTIISSTVISAHGLIIANDHDMHHMHFNCNYGTGFYMDYLFDTEKKLVPSNLKRMRTLKTKIHKNGVILKQHLRDRRQTPETSSKARPEGSLRLYKSVLG